MYQYSPRYKHFQLFCYKVQFISSKFWRHKAKKRHRSPRMTDVTLVWNCFVYHQLHETQAADQSRGSHPREKVSHRLFSPDKPEHEQILMFPSFSAAYSAFSRLTGSAWKRHWRAVISRPAGWAYVRLIAPETRWQTGRLRISGGCEFEGFTKKPALSDRSTSPFLNAWQMTSYVFNHSNKGSLFVCLSVLRQI